MLPRVSRLFSHIHSPLALLVCLALGFLFTGCAGVSPKSGGGTTSAPTVTISASPNSIAPGGTSTLTVTAANATSVTLTGSDSSSYPLQPTGGTQSVSPAATVTYTATATGAGGTTSSTAIVTVTPLAAPTVTIVADPTSISSGSSSILTVTAANATQVTLSGSDGTTYTLQPNGGPQSVTPATTTTYTATATGTGGTTTATATVTVTKNPAPTVGITANPTSVIAGSSSILTVTATNATQVTLTGSDGSTYPIQPSGGTQAVSPAATTTYTATATGAGGKASATATLTVTKNPVPTVTMTASPASIVAGTSSTLTVDSSNATQVIITGTDGSSYTLEATSGTQAVSPAATTTYTASATGPGGTTTATAVVTVTKNPPPTVAIAANPTSITSGASSTLTVTATNSTQVTIAGDDGSNYTLQPSGGTQSVSPTATTTYTATATGAGGSVTASTTVQLVGSGTVNDITHVVFMLQENHSFDNYFGMLNPYRVTNGWNKGDDGNIYTVDGIDDKLTTISNKNDEGTVFSPFKFKTVCIDDESSAWLESYGDVNRYNFQATRPILMDGFVHTAEGFAKSCSQPGAKCSGQFTDTAGQRAMGYYDQGFLNYYYYMASQFAVSDRWFSPVASKSIANRIATFTGGTTQGLVQDPTSNDKLTQLQINSIFHELSVAHVTWKIYYTVTDGGCLGEDDCIGGGSKLYPATDFSNLGYSYNFLYTPTATHPCNATAQPSSVVGDPNSTFCIDPTHIAPLNDPNYGYFHDLTNGTLPSFAFIEAGYGQNDEHPASGGNILVGQAQVAKIVNAFMASPEWKDSVFFLSYDEGGGPYDHVPPVPGHSNDYTDASQVSNYPDIGSIAVNPDAYAPCVPPPPGTATKNCDLKATWPGATPGDAAYVAAAQDPTGLPQGFGAQLGFRVPNMIISPFTRRHYVSHIPMDHTAIIKFVEDRFISGNPSLTARDAAQPSLLNFFDFTNVPWATPPTPPTPAPASQSPNVCTPASM